jgi:hypothetical protein
MIPDKEEIDSFFGVSGRSWTPQALYDLLGKAMEVKKLQTE